MLCLLPTHCVSFDKFPNSNNLFFGIFVCEIIPFNSMKPLHLSLLGRYRRFTFVKLKHSNQFPLALFRNKDNPARTKHFEVTFIQIGGLSILWDHFSGSHLDLMVLTFSWIVCQVVIESSACRQSSYRRLWPTTVSWTYIALHLVITNRPRYTALIPYLQIGIMSKACKLWFWRIYTNLKWTVVRRDALCVCSYSCTSV